MAGMIHTVQMVIDDQRAYAPGMAATAAIEQAISTVKLHRIITKDPISRAYAAVLRHPSQARFDAREIERHERDQYSGHERAGSSHDEQAKNQG